MDTFISTIISEMRCDSLLSAVSCQQPVRTFFLQHSSNWTSKLWGIPCPLGKCSCHGL